MKKKENEMEMKNKKKKNRSKIEKKKGKTRTDVSWWWSRVHDSNGRVVAGTTGNGAEVFSEKHITTCSW